MVSLSLFGVNLRIWVRFQECKSNDHLFKMQLHRKALILVIKQKNVYSISVQHAAKPVPSNNIKGDCCIRFINEKWYHRLIVIHAMNLRVFYFKERKLIQSSLCWPLDNAFILCSLGRTIPNKNG